MKRIFYFTIIIFLASSCAATADENNETEATYNKNLANFKALMDAWNNQDVESALTLMADDFIETGTGFGEQDKNKEEWKTANEGMMTIMKPTLKQAIYLPGIDTVSMEMDGSVRYYGTWNFAVGEKDADLKVYGTADFNDEGLITSLAHYADFSITMMQIMPEEMVQQMMGGTQE